MNCIQSIQTKIDNNELETIQQLSPDVATPIFITSTIKQLFILEVVRQETIRFIISLISNIQPNNVGVTIHIYRLNVDNTFILLGTVLVTEMIIDFQQDLNPGIYIICIGSTSFSYTGTFKGIFTGFQYYSKLFLNSNTGSSLNSFNLEFEIKDKECDKLLYFSLIDGSLPPGLTISYTGNIEGILPNLDCIDDDQPLSPSQNWYYPIEKHWMPWRKTMAFFIKSLDC